MIWLAVFKAEFSPPTLSPQKHAYFFIQILSLASILPVAQILKYGFLICQIYFLRKLADKTKIFTPFSLFCQNLHSNLKLLAAYSLMAISLNLTVTQKSQTDMSPKNSRNSSLSALRVKFARILQRKNDGFRENLQGCGRVFAGAFFA